MGKIRIRGKNKIYTVKNFTKYPEEVNVLLLQSINSGDIPGILQIEYESFGRKAELTVTVRNCEPLSLYLAPPASAENFVDAMLRIALILKEIDARQMNLGSLDLQMDRVFVNPVSKELYCIYWPTANNTEEHAPQEFLSRVPVRLQFKSYSAKKYVDPYLAFFASGQPFSVRAFERKMQEIAALLPPEENSLLSKLSSASENPPVPGIAPAPAVPPVPGIAPAPAVPPVPGVSAIPGTPPVSAVPPVSGFPPVPNRFTAPGTPPVSYSSFSGGPFSSNTGTIRMTPGERDVDDSGIMIEYVPPTETDDFGNYNDMWGRNSAPNRKSSRGQSQTAYLTLAATGESRVIYSEIFRIGTDPSCSFRTANPYVSRFHAAIQRRGTQYFLLDLQSLNGTFMNGARIPGNGEVEIHNGTHFFCATEEFIFSVEAR